MRYLMNFEGMIGHRNILSKQLGILLGHLALVRCLWVLTHLWPWDQSLNVMDTYYPLPKATQNSSSSSHLLLVGTRRTKSRAVTSPKRWSHCCRCHHLRCPTNPQAVGSQQLSWPGLLVPLTPKRWSAQTIETMDKWRHQPTNQLTSLAVWPCLYHILRF